MGKAALWFAIVVGFQLCLGSCYYSSKDKRFPLAAHSNFVRSNYFHHVSPAAGRSGEALCAGNASVCSDAEKYPLGRGKGTCCFDRICKATSSDESNCGACGVACGYRMSCCEGRCVDLMSNARHCGRCGAGCSRGEDCEMGMCGYGGGGYDDEERSGDEEQKHYPKQW